MANRSRTTPPTAAQKRLAADRAAAARERIRAEQRRRRVVVVAGAVGAVVLLAAILVVVRLSSGSSGPKSGEQARPAVPAVATSLSSIPASAYDTVGLGDARSAPQATTGAALVSGRLPRVLFVGAEWCPFCAAERWAVVTALARFGTFTGLGQTRSSPTDVDANTPTLAFHGSTYSSRYLAFTPYEVQSNQVSGGKYTPLDTLPGPDKALWEKSGGTYPFLDLGGSYILQSAQYDPGVLGGSSKTQAQVAVAIKNPSTAIAKSVLGSANVLTADLCKLTKGQPTAVCSSSAVRTATSALPSGS